MSEKALMDDVEQFAREKDLLDALDDLKKGALVAQRKNRFETIEMLTEEDKKVIRREKENRWDQPMMMYYMTSKFCSSSYSSEARLHQHKLYTWTSIQTG